MTTNTIIKMIDMNLQNIEEAKKHALIEFQNKYGTFSVEFNLGKRKEHFEVYAGYKMFYCLFKRHFFYQFGKIFNLKGAGETINDDVLAYILTWSFNDIIFIYPDGKMYSVTPQEWQKYVQENSTLRYTEEGEHTTSISVRLLKRFNPEEEIQPEQN